jgi:hypothetical protein
MIDFQAMIGKTLQLSGRASFLRPFHPKAPLFPRETYPTTKYRYTRIRHNIADCEVPHMKEWIKDTIGLGIMLWLIGYLVSVVLFFSPFAGIMGWIISAVFTPVTIAITWWWFRARNLPLTYYAGVGMAWTVIAVVFDYLFIVQLFQATYYGPDVFLYYALTFLIPVCVGYYLVRIPREPLAKRG